MDQIDQWLSLPPQKKREWMDGLLETVVLEDMRHPAYRRFKELYEPLGLRREERAQRYKKVFLATTLSMIQCPNPSTWGAKVDARIVWGHEPLGPRREERTQRYCRV